MKALLIGGTGTISTAISALCIEKGWELDLLNRGNRSEFVPLGARVLRGDMNDEQSIAALLKDAHYDVVADFIAFTPEQVERDIRLFTGKTQQYFFISSASAYQKPLSDPWITESTPLANPYWQYSRDKIACEEVLMKAYRTNGFPVTIIRPSHTYGVTSVPVCCHGSKGSFSVLERIRTGRKVIIPGDGLTLWTLTHNTDFAKAFVGLMGNAHAIGHPFQITSDERLTWNQIYQTIADAMGVELRAVHIASETLAKAHQPFWGEMLGDKSNTVLFDCSKVKHFVPDFVATKRFDQGVRESLSYVYAHLERQTPDPEYDAWTDAVIAAYERMENALPKL